jgi:DmsE family decaheme c-type cytochrome
MHMALRRSPAVTWMCAVAVAALAAAVTVLALPGFAQAPPKPSPEPKPPAAESKPPAAEPPVCVKCHEEAWVGFSQTRHAVRGDARTPFGTGRDCQACHGDASEHLKNPAKNPIPQRFLKETPGRERSAVCLTCHVGNRHLTFWESGRHAKNDVACNNCHNVHAAPPPASVAGALQQRDATISPFVTTIRQLEYKTCTTCHMQIRSALLKPSHHPLMEGKIKCSDCHNPHGALSPAMVKNESVNDLCVTCHSNKRGPYMWEHPPVEENCLTCHQSHGSPHNKLLTEKVPNLCQDCHDAGRHPGAFYDGSQGWQRPPSLGGPNTRFIARSCLNCHGNIHGSNAPANRGQFFLR